MKKRRTIIISLLLVAALCLGIGYAGFAIDLIVNGSATLRGEAPNVVFSAATIKSFTNNDIKDRAGIGSTGTASLDITSAGFASVDDELVVTITIKNNHNFDVTVTEPAINLTKIDNVDYFKVTTTWGDDDKTITALGEVQFDLSIKLIKDTSDELTQKYTVTFEAFQGTQGVAATTEVTNP